MCKGPLYAVVYDYEKKHIVPCTCMFSGIRMLHLCYLCGHKEAYEFASVSKGSKY
jgi:hypothetical protein